MPYIVETPPSHPGIKKYISRAEPPSRSIRLAGIRDEAIRYATWVEADAARSRLSSLYGLVIIELTEPNGGDKSAPAPSTAKVRP